MEWMIMLLVALLIVAWFAVRSAGWKTVQAATGGNAEELEAKYAYLKSNNVKCKLRSEAGAGVGIAQPGIGEAAGHSTVKLYVHKKDVERATELLEQFERESKPY
ncbi:hypothetical protein [Paenibacillus flagellatus]|uniref:DUF2007 domain-containing protein n=1 Tax=Paenibacillus flagellatus TaxID=2211139 RepID=A0A2V5K081_9BACL|nr:hypothetical protein [Paenibacillus flagellatus]PYI52569.1 hypothetical protein DLM86_20565 [Paenibacillus flagellatus]